MSDSNELNFLPIPGYEGLYEVSAAGDIRSLYGKGCILRPTLTAGYPGVTLVKDGKKRTVRVHDAMCSAFYGPRPSPEHEAAHGDGNRQNNVLSNLSWKTCKANHADKKLHCTNLVGDRHHQVKIPDSMVQVIAKEYVKGSKTHGIRALGEKYGLSLCPMHRIVTGKRQVAHHG